MRMVALGVAVLLGVSCVALIAQGQDVVPRAGTRVRVTVPGERTSHPAYGAERAARGQVGTFVMVRADSITLGIGDSTTIYGLDEVSRFEVSRGRRSHWLTGAGVGLLMGAGAAFVVLRGGGSTALCDHSANQDAISPGECIAVGVGVSVAGAALGALIGGLVRTERWQDVPVDGLRAGLTLPRSRDFRVAMVLAF